MDNLLGRLPGLAPHPYRSRTLIKESDELRPIVVRFLRLFGYRKERVHEDGTVTLERRDQGCRD